MQIVPKAKAIVLELLETEGYTEVKESLTYNRMPVIEVTNPEQKITLVLFREENNIIAFSSKVSHSMYSECELTSVEQKIHYKLSA